MFRIAARTVLELGSELISSDVIAFYELIKNGFDAGTRTGVDIKFDIVLPRNTYLKFKRKIEDGDNILSLKDQIIEEINPSANSDAQNGFEEAIIAAKSREKLLDALNKAQAHFNTITITDTGEGMSCEDLEKNFLVIGTPSRKREIEAALKTGASKPPYLGEKGIGRLSAMRLGERLRVETSRQTDNYVNILEIDWRVFGELDVMLDEVHVQPTRGKKKTEPLKSGTSIIISDLSENWTEARVRRMAEYDFSRLTDPFDNASTRPRIAMYWNNDRITIPVMPAALLDAAHGKVSGRYEYDAEGIPSLSCTFEAIDLDFDHPQECENINFDLADLQGAIIGKDSHIDDDALNSVGPFSFEAYWYNRRRLSRIDGIGDQRAVRALQEKWSGIMLFRDRFRVFPYGEDDDDWLSLDRKAMRRSGYTLNKMQFVGHVNISRTANPKLVDQTNREGLRITPEQEVFLQVIQYAVQDRLGAFFRDIERQYKNQKIDLSDAQVRVEKLEDRAKKAISHLKRLTPPEGNEAIEDLQQTLFEFAEFAARARQRIEEVEQESRQMIEMAGVGLMVEVVAHELARASENALKVLERIRGRRMPEELQAHFNNLQAELKSVSKRIRVLDPLSVSGRQRSEIFSLNELIADTIDAHDAQFTRHHVKIISELPEQVIRIRAVKGMVVQILENLISNSIYWLSIRLEREKRFHPEIRIILETSPPTIIYEDNGPGIAPDNKEKIFKPFFSLKDTNRRRGLGLFIAREAAQHNEGTLILDSELNPETGRLHRFVFELPQGVKI